MSIVQGKNDIQFIDEKAESVGAQKSNQIIQIDNFQVLGLEPDDSEFYINFGEERRRKVIHKVCRQMIHINLLMSDKHKG
jgi:hypothetical protein